MVSINIVAKRMVGYSCLIMINTVHKILLFTKLQYLYFLIDLYILIYRNLIESGKSFALPRVFHTALNPELFLFLTSFLSLGKRMFLSHM